MTEKALLTGPLRGNLIHLFVTQAVGDEQQTCLLTGGNLFHGKGDGPRGVTALQRHDVGAQIGQQQGDGLMIPGGGHGEIGVASVENERNPGVVGSAKQLLKLQSDPGSTIRF